MQLKAIIIEDEVDNQIYLNNLLSNFCTGVEVVADADCVFRGVSAIQLHQPDLVFLDIELPNESGFALFDYFPNPSFETIFTTAYNQYALKAFKQSAIDYLLKPIDLEELRNALQTTIDQKMLQVTQKKLEVLKENMNSLHRRLVLPTQNGFSFIELKDILYCHAQGNYTLFFLKNKDKILVSKTLKIYTEILEEFNFFRVSRSHLVNINHIKKYGRFKSPIITMSNGTEIVVSIHRKDHFLEQIGHLL